MSRAELQRRLGLRINTVIEVVEAMVRAGWVREAGRVALDDRPRGEGRGRPAVRMEIDPDRRRVIGLALTSRRVEGVRLNLHGQAVGKIASQKVAAASDLGRVAAKLVRRLRDDRTLAVGVSSTGLIDEGDMKLLYSAATPDAGALSLGPLLAAVEGCPIALENDIQALGDRWRLDRDERISETVLLIGVGDGRIGASLMPGGGPADAGCVRGSNELGHMQVRTVRAVPTCYCGRRGCLERVFSSAMVRELTGSGVRLATVLRKIETQSEAGPINLDFDEPMKECTGGEARFFEVGGWILARLAEVVADAVNFTRPHRVVWAELSDRPLLGPATRAWLDRRVAGLLLPVLRDRVAFEAWRPGAVGGHATAEASEPSAGGDTKSFYGKASGGGSRTGGGGAVTAGHLALAMLTGRRRPASGGVDLIASPHPAVKVQESDP
jgi:predicted NBD/HSP70 family sugar kinase